MEGKGKTLNVLLCLFLYWLNAGFSAETTVSSLVQEELAFSQTTGKVGIKEGFLSYLAEDSILFRPGPVPGRKWMMDHPAPPGFLSWEPTYAEVSGAGDLGFTTGPFEFRNTPAAEPSGYGQFFSVWQKQSDGSWKVVLDAGISHDRPSKRTELRTRSGKAAAVSKEQLARDTQLLASTDESAAAISREIMSEDVITLRNLRFPQRGIQKSEKAALADCKYERQHLQISKSADLAYVYGTYKCASESGVYVRVWRKEAIWEIALDYRRAL